MEKNVVFDYIIELIKAINVDDVLYVDEDKWTGSTYLLGQIIRQFVIPTDHYFVSKKAKELWDSITDDRIVDYWYQRKVVCTRGPVEIKEFTGNSKTFRKRFIQQGDKFVYRAVFHDEHIVPVKVIIHELCCLSDYSYQNIRDVLSKIRICKMLKEEDKLIPHKSNRSSDYATALQTDYFSVGIDVLSVDQCGELSEFVGTPTSSLTPNVSPAQDVSWPINGFIDAFILAHPQDYLQNAGNTSSKYKYLYPNVLIRKGLVNINRKQTVFSLWIYLAPAAGERRLKLYADAPNGLFNLPQCFHQDGRFYSAVIGSLDNLLSDSGMKTLAKNIIDLISQIASCN